MPAARRSRTPQTACRSRGSHIQTVACADSTPGHSGFRNRDRRRPQHLFPDGVAVADNADHPAVVLAVRGGNGADRFVLQWIELGSLNIDPLDAESFEFAEKLAANHLDALKER